MAGCFSASCDSESCLDQFRDCCGISNCFGGESEPRFEPRPRIDLPVLQIFKLYETPSKFYLVGRNESKTYWRVLAIDRTKIRELDIYEDSQEYSQKGIAKWLVDKNEEYGGFTDITICYGIIGFVKFLEPYYMLLITKRKKVGEICGHTVYAIAESKTITIPMPTIQTRVANSDAENKYKNLLGMVDLSQNFYFSYTYHLMYSLQKNVRNTQRGKIHHESMFVWNAFLTKGIRSTLRNSIWTVALVYGFFQQTKCLVSGKEFVFTLIARRSRHFAGTRNQILCNETLHRPGSDSDISERKKPDQLNNIHVHVHVSKIGAGSDMPSILTSRCLASSLLMCRYSKRGISERGRVANEVETEQIVSKVDPECQKIPIASVVQIRGSIPLFWSQDHSLTNPQPKIKLDKRKDPKYMTTQHHFENLRQRYGKRIIILNLLKSAEKKNREIFLRAEFAMAIDIINRVTGKENRLKGITCNENHLTAIHFDLSKEYKKGVNGAFSELCDHAKDALKLTDLFSCEAPSGIGAEAVINDSFSNNPRPSQDEEASTPENEALKPDISKDQNGVLRTNCIDCLDRTNFAQYAHGLAALELQLSTLGISGPPVIDIANPLAVKLMDTYLNMGNTLALQYGGSEAHIKMFSDLRGNWNMVGRHRDYMTAAYRHFNNTYPDKDKQNAINVFLGHFRPLSGRALRWDQHNIGRYNSKSDLQNIRPVLQRSYYDNNAILEEPEPEDPQPSDEGGISGNTLNLAYESEPESMSFPSVMHNEDLLREVGSGKMFVGSSSNSDSHIPNDIPGFAHSYDTKFTPAEETTESLSTSSSLSEYLFIDVDETIITNDSTNTSFNIDVDGDGGPVFPGYSNVFSKWVFSRRSWA